MFQANLITRKDTLARSLKRMRMVYGSVYNFSPVSFNLPNDYTKFLSYHTKIQNKKGRQVNIQITLFFKHDLMHII